MNRHKSMKFKLLLAFVMMGCAAVSGAETKTQPAATQPLTTEAAPAPVVSSPTVTPAAPAPTTGPDYLIGPGDVIQVFVWRNPELTTSIPVRPDGRISTPLVEDMVAVGKTPSALARDIEKVLGDYVRSPQVNVIVTQPVSVFSQVRIIGQVAKPQAIAYREGMTVLDAVLAVGGLGQFAAGNRARLMRKVDGKPKEIRIKLGALVNDGDMAQNIALLPGDVLVIPETRF
jgi:polysaccharide export outer membrane protein